MVKSVRKVALSQMEKAGSLLRGNEKKKCNSWRRGGTVKAKILLVMTILIAIVAIASKTSYAISTDDLIKLKKAGIPEDIILFMNDADYKDVEKVLKLKEAGFKNETILSIIKKDLKEKPPTESLKKEPVTDAAAQGGQGETTAKIKILWYMAYSANPALLSSQAIDNARISVASPGRLKFEWEDKGFFSIVMKDPFHSPFYWDINKDDVVGPGKNGYPYMLRSGVHHKGRPDTDDSHFWVIYLNPADTRILDYIKENL
ncbi:MAG TPA: hypothetical protein DCP92_06100 [Nitrospiraceae bacterium]|jgi:hypothetical protein|nr:hypothetical protein [Nitrospiraceae bacterium]